MVSINGLTATHFAGLPRQASGGNGAVRHPTAFVPSPKDWVIAILALVRRHLLTHTGPFPILSLVFSVPIARHDAGLNRGTILSAAMAVNTVIGPLTWTAQKVAPALLAGGRRKFNAAGSTRPRHC